MILTAPEELSNKLDDSFYFKVFLAGTIDSGDSEDWQSKICEKFKDDDTVVIFNPRRSVWPKDSDHNEVRRQIDWELKRLDESDLIIMNILPNSKSPISLMEIGLYAQSGKLAIFCNEDFYRWDNIAMVCNKYYIDILMSNDTQDIINVITKKCLDNHFEKFLDI